MLLHFIFGQIFVTDLSSIVMDVTSRDKKLGLLYVSGKLPNYPSPKPTFWPK